MQYVRLTGSSLLGKTLGTMAAGVLTCIAKYPLATGYSQ